MTQTELELLAVLIILYANDCLYWLSPDDLAFSRSFSMTWKSHRNAPLSFTLLGRMPVLIDPLLLLPGFVRSKSSKLTPSAKIDRDLRKVAKRLCRLWIIELQCRVQAMLLLLFLPWIVWTHRLILMWQSFLAVLVLSHFLLMVSSIIALRQSSIARPFSVAAPLLLNPLGAVRILDVFSQRYFDKLVSHRYTHDSGTPKK